MVLTEHKTPCIASTTIIHNALQPKKKNNINNKTLTKTVHKRSDRSWKGRPTSNTKRNRSKEEEEEARSLLYQVVYKSSRMWPAPPFSPTHHGRTAPPAKKARRPNFSDAESLALIEAVTERKDVLFSKLGNEVTAGAKAAAWEEVKEVVNMVSRVCRDTEEVKRKFKDLRVAVKRKASQDIKHMEGGGPAKDVNYTEVESAVLALIPPSGYAGPPVPETGAGPLNVAGSVEDTPSSATLPAVSRDAVSDLVDVLRQNTAAVLALADAQRQTAAVLNKVVDIISKKQYM